MLCSKAYGSRVSVTQIASGHVKMVVRVEGGGLLLLLLRLALWWVKW